MFFFSGFQDELEKIASGGGSRKALELAFKKNPLRRALRKTTPNPDDLRKYRKSLQSGIAEQKNIHKLPRDIKELLIATHRGSVPQTKALQRVLRRARKGVTDRGLMPRTSEKSRRALMRGRRRS